MGLFSNTKEPEFLKESSSTQAQLELLKSFEEKLNEEGKIKLKQDIKYLEYGIAGESNIAFELKNSHMPMYILRDIYLEDGDLNAQIDYLVFTKKLCFIIECKNLVGNIEINSAGDFIRTMVIDGKKKREGIYSPITQNQRHLELMKKLNTNLKTNVFSKFMAERYFDDYYKSIVVLANPKTILNYKYAKKEIKNQVIKADQLVSYINTACKDSKESNQSDKSMLSWAQSYLSLHKEIVKDYTSKYSQYLLNSDTKEQEQISSSSENPNKEVESYNVNNSLSIEETAIFKELKAYRLTKSREENIKPYFIYNDNQLKDLISKMPITLASLKTVSGFGETKALKYGEDIVGIVKRYV
ncbi:NERD domain-containing protein [Anaerocolumna sp. AGMB13025]|uniref:HRDC domain-containing protein n=1 Tax=Anaerocolumna sp. AGMB13025 TaxID=3039116 RepID=UPI00241D97BC|nr:NERD domain-containing protein [Anaerocolumna sp. AGMB13025]WFR56715.1 NERD domain-containing protein [Anaerocolumna sp. AGMB13025]